MNPDDLLTEFTRKQDLYRSLADRTANLLKILVNDSNINIHIIEQRAKTYESLRDKLNRPNKKYNDLSEIPDLSGVRIITYYQDDCEKICDIILNEFEVIEIEDSHRPDSLESDRFGYISIHRIVKTHPDRKNLVEWKDVSDAKCEIQVRTVIQHAWAAVSHQVQYKLENQAPSALQRKLNRISGLFELADEQFMSARDDRNSLENDLLDNNYFEIAEINPTSIEKFVTRWSEREDIVNISKSIGFQFDEYPDGEIIENILYLCNKAKYKDLSELGASIGKYNKEYMKIIKANDKGDSPWVVNNVFCVLLHIILSQAKTIEISDLVDYGWDEDIAEKVIGIAKSMND